ncbi:MAG: heparinase II/III-family protein [Alphaproteobacteria bacterium]|nr:heparinase II/III-family protein [Alphaproteobacteria bacterium]
MIDALIRKSRQVLADPVLRRYLLRRALGRIAAPPPFAAHRPPYLADLPLAPPAAATLSGPELPVGRPAKPLTLALPGQTMILAPGDEDSLVRATFADTETLLGMHRFAWLPLAGPEIDPTWVVALWRAWDSVHGTPDDSWAWHPYTAAERAINLLDFARRAGLPARRDDFARRMALHAVTISERLEYFGDHHTGNHMANNGRGLAVIGLALGWTACADMGVEILLNEARRIFLPSGVLREGSSHYHLLLTRGYVSAWLAARAAGHGGADRLEKVAARLLAAAPCLTLDGRLPLIGDISPDCPPDFLLGLLPDAPPTGWVAGLAAAEQEALDAMRRALAPTDPSALSADGWHRAAFGPWQGLWHAAPHGWAHMPGHGHQDLGAAELHWRGVPLFVDLGRGAYGDDGDAALYRSAWAHGGLTVDGADPYPPNRPYYDDSFRTALGGPPPRVAIATDGVRLTHHGYGRLGAATVERHWRFDGDRLELTDRVTGRGRHDLERRLPSVWPARTDNGAVLIETPAGNVRVAAEVPLTIEPATRWTAYGEGSPAAIVVARTRAALPWTGTLTVEPC